MKKLNKAQQALFDAHIADYSIPDNKHYFGEVSRANLFHDILNLGDDCRLACLHSSNDFKIFDVVTTTKEETEAFDAVMEQRTNLIKLFDERKNKRLFNGKKEYDLYHSAMMKAVGNYRNWPEVEEIVMPTTDPEKEAV